MAGSSEVVVKFLADTSGVRAAADDVKAHAGRISGYAKLAGAAISAMFAVRTIGNWVDQAEEAEKRSAVLAKTLANAGDASGEWAAHAEKLSDTLRRQTGIDDEVIKGAQGILATFHNVGGSVGQTSGAFDRASKAALDMSKAGFGDADSAAKQLGKALENPIKGLTALNRSGITFTDGQKKVIKAFVDSGNQAGAMSAILDVVEGQVGGVAAASATAGDKMSAAWQEAQEALGGLLLPALEALTPIIGDLSDWVQVTLIPALSDLSAWVGDHIVPAVKDFATTMADRLTPAIKRAADWVTTKLLPGIQSFVRWIIDHRTEIGSFFTPLVDAVRTVIPWVIGLAKAFLELGRAFVERLADPLKTLGDWVASHKESIPILAIAITGALVPAFYAWATAATAAATATTVAAITAAVALLPAILVIGLIATAIYVAAQLLGGFGDSWEEFKNILSTIWEWISGHWPLLNAIFFSPFQVIPWIIDHAGQMLDAFKAVGQWLLDHWALLASIIIGPIAFAIDWVVSHVGAIVAPFEDAYNRIHGIVDKINSLSIHIPGSLGGGGPFNPVIPGFGPIFGHAKGGIFTTPHIGLVAESGPEAIIPLDGRHGLGSTIIVNVTTTGLGADSPTIQRQVAETLRNFVGRNGPL